jgi:hypothetical protein
MQENDCRRQETDRLETELARHRKYLPFASQDVSWHHRSNHQSSRDSGEVSTVKEDIFHHSPTVYII